MKISVIIAFYKNLAALDLILEAFTKQRYKNFEVVVAEDDCLAGTVEYVKNKSKQLPYTLLHVNQKEDLGFRKNEILNRAIAATTGEFLFFLDGDCIPHAYLLKEYASLAEDSIALYGRRVMVSEKLTVRLLAEKNLKLLTLFNLSRYKSTRLEDGIYLPFFNKKNDNKKSAIWGCNWGIFKKHIIDVNGFDEDYIRAGVGEDVDIEWRLIENGIKLRSLKHRAIVYHLHHKANYSEADTKINYRLMDEKQKLRQLYCLNGLDKHLAK